MPCGATASLLESVISARPAVEDQTSALFIPYLSQLTRESAITLDVGNVLSNGAGQAVERLRRR